MTSSSMRQADGPARCRSHDTFAIITRPGARLSTGVRELLADVEAHMRGFAARLDRSR